MKVPVLHSENESNYPCGETEAVPREIRPMKDEGIKNFY
jgi:hypothetical protein